MKDFKYYAPTEVVFGKNAEYKTGELVKKYGGTKVLLHYGSASAERSGLLGVIRESLTAAGIGFVELGGVVPNPHLELVYEGIKLCKDDPVNTNLFSKGL